MSGNGTGNTSTRNVRYINQPGTYVIRDVDDVIECDTTNGEIILELQNIYGSGLILTPRTIYVNDSSGNAATTAIRIQASGGDKVNGSSFVSISVASGSLAFDVLDQKDWIAVGDGIPSGSPIGSGLVIVASTTDNINYTGSLTGITSYSQLLNEIITLIIPSANLGMSTLNINALGIKSILKFVNVQTESNDYKPNQRLVIIYDGINFQITSVTCNIAEGN